MTVRYSEHDIGKHRKKVENTRFDTDFYVRIEEGPFAGVEFVFGAVAIYGGEGRSLRHIDFQYNVVHAPSDLKKVVREDFERTLSEILEHRLLQVTELDGGNPEDIIAADTPDLFVEGTVHEFNPDEIVDTP